MDDSRPPSETAPTDSHALATADEEVGAAQVAHAEPEVKDLGWDETAPAPLVGGLSNEELWTLIRRFDKQMYHVKAMAEDPPGGLDLNVADEEEFSSDKLRSNVERLYMTVIVGMAGFLKHIARLRSWNEFRRTTAFCVVYYAAWFTDALSPVLLLTMAALVVYPPSRAFLFPPAPLALVDATSGTLKKPAAGVLGSHGTLTGAPEGRKGEALEQEAHNFVSSFGAIAMSSAAGEHPENPIQEEASTMDMSAPDPKNVALAITDAQDSARGRSTDVSHDKTKKPVEIAMWEKARPVMHIVGDIADGWERFANALSPTPPFPQSKHRMVLAGVLAPAILASLFTSAYASAKCTTFFAGAGFFGDPIISRVIPLLDRKFPDWRKYLELRSTILRGVPTNAQLTITLLRVGEAHKAPLPPPPGLGPPPPAEEPAAIPESHIPPGVSTAAAPEKQQQRPPPPPPPPAPKKNLAKCLLGLLKGTTKTGVATALGADKVKATAGSESAKNRLGVLDSSSPLPGPVEFKGRYHGKRGYIYVVVSAASPFVCFTTLKYAGKIEEVQFSLPMANVRELRKLGGLGWKSKLVVGWAMEKEVVDGLEIVDSDGVGRTLTAIPLRDELFNRLVAMGPQKWVSL